MKIAYMGTPDFAVPPLIKLIEAGYEISMVISQPDRPKNRGKKLLKTPVKEMAEKYGIPVFQPEGKEESDELYARLKNISPDIIIVAAYGRILKEEILNLPRLGCINIHASLLPRHRGAAPIQRAVLEGDEETGITLMHMSAGMDEGDMIAAMSTPVDRKTSGELFEELAWMGADLLLDTLPLIEKGSGGRIPQNEKLATYAPKITKEEGRIDFSKGSHTIERQIRAMSPWPGAFTNMGDKTMKVLEADIISGNSGSRPGEIKSADRDGLLVATGEGDLLIKKIQMPGKQPLEIAEYIKGNKIEIGLVLG